MRLSHLHRRYLLREAFPPSPHTLSILCVWPLPSRAPCQPSRAGWRPGEPLGACLFRPLRSCPCTVCGPGLPHSPVPPLRAADRARGLLRSPFLEAMGGRGQGQEARLGPGARDASPPTVCLAHSLNLPSLSFPSGWNILRDHLQQRLRAGSGVRPPGPSPLLPGSVGFSALTVVVAIRSQCPLACTAAPGTVPTGPAGMTFLRSLSHQVSSSLPRSSGPMHSRLPAGIGPAWPPSASAGSCLASVTSCLQPFPAWRPKSLSSQGLTQSGAHGPGPALFIPQACVHGRPTQLPPQTRLPPAGALIWGHRSCSQEGLHRGSQNC